MDVAGSSAGAVSAARNTAAQAGATLSSLAFGYIVRGTGSYKFALMQVAAVIALSALVCLRVDATELLFPNPSADFK
jgi:predicted MFS family arabinose efflux permease